MLLRDKFYENLGTYYSSPEEIKNQLNSKIFNDFKIVINIIGINQPQEDLTPIYKIQNLELSSTNKNSKLQDEIDDINKYLLSAGTELGYKDEKNSWSLFYLIKEMITSFQRQGYNYYRGQREDWETVPGIFRNLQNSEGNKYCNTFESLYLNISREFPDEVKYVPLNQEMLDIRADELAILQHYGLPTSLLDISENPFIAMLFMLGFGKIKNPQLEFYKIDSSNDSENGIISLVHKKITNKRIRAQKGAFINFDKLIKFINFKKNEIELENYKPIDRIILNIKFDIEASIKSLKNQQSSNHTNPEDDLSSKNLDGVIKFLEGKSVKSGSDKNNQEERISGDYYELIQRELLRKLKEYNYETNALFPDFSDYLIYKSKEFELKDDKKSNRAVLNELKKNSNNLPYHKSKKNRKGKYRITRVWRKSL